MSEDTRLTRLESKVDVAIDALGKIAVILEKVENQEAQISDIHNEQKEQSKRLYEVEKDNAVAEERHKEIKADNKATRETISKAAWWCIGLMGSLLLAIIGLLLKNMTVVAS